MQNFNKSMSRHFENLTDRLSSVKLVRTIQSSLTILIPVLMIGSFALIIRSFPINAYQNFLSSTWLGIIIYEISTVLYISTFGMLSLYMAVSIGYNTPGDNRKDPFYVFGSVLTSVICFLISIGLIGVNYSIAYLGVNGMFMAIFSSVISSTLFCVISDHRKSFLAGYTYGANYAYNRAISSIFPILAVVMIFTAFHMILTDLFKVNCLQEMFVNLTDLLFSRISSNFLQGLVFVILSSVLWFFGIHGSDVLNNINEGIFQSYMDANVAALQNGGGSQYIVSKTFIDVFVLMGGCGVTICLLIAIVFFCKLHNNRRLAQTAFFPMIFNINELMVFGLPIIFRPILLVPFILSPVLVFLSSYIAMATGIVPIAATTVEWTTPVFLSGYLATNSVAGLLLQLFNIAMGTAIYIPFVKIMEKEQIHSYSNSLDTLVGILKKSEEDNTPVTLGRLTGNNYSIVKMLTLDLRHALENNELNIFYQPQFNNNMECIGAEALLRWKHHIVGNIYPPLIIKLAEEEGFLEELEKYVIRTAITDYIDNKDAFKQTDDFKISLNITASSMNSESIEKLLDEMSRTEGFERGHICIEITEQSALKLSNNISEFFKRIHTMGYLLAIDDFSMGHTSLKYLQDNSFDLVKLDGSLVKNLNNERCEDIIKSIIYLAQSLDFSVLAEYVETEEQMKRLLSIGCERYQGWLYSPAISLDKFLDFIGQKNKVSVSK